jgi:hypothetical protein
MLKSQQQTFIVMITNIEVTTPSTTTMCQLKGKKANIVTQQKKKETK